MKSQVAIFLGLSDSVVETGRIVVYRSEEYEVKAVKEVDYEGKKHWEMYGVKVADDHETGRGDR